MDNNPTNLENVSQTESVVPPKKRRLGTIIQSYLDIFQKALSSLNEDECDVFGNYVASKLRSLSNDHLKRKMER